MTSLIHGVAERVSAVRADLPLGLVATATDRIRAAGAVLAAALAGSAVPPLLLAAATDHLDAAAGALWRADADLERYLADLGVAVAGVTPSSVERVDEWADRVDAVTGCAGRPRPAVRLDVPVEGTLVDAVRAASRGDRVALRDVLVAAPEAVGRSLTTRCASLLAARVRTVEPVRVRRAATARIADLLPGLDGRTPDRLLTQALLRPPAAGLGRSGHSAGALPWTGPRAAAAGGVVPPHPRAGAGAAGGVPWVDAGVAGVVMLAGLLAVGGDDPESLVRGRG